MPCAISTTPSWTGCSRRFRPRAGVAASCRRRAMRRTAGERTRKHRAVQRGLRRHTKRQPAPVTPGQERLIRAAWEAGLRAGGDRPGIPCRPRAGRTCDRCCTPSAHDLPRCVALPFRRPTACRRRQSSGTPDHPLLSRRTIDVWIEIGRQEAPVRPRVGGESGIFDGERPIYVEAGSTAIRPWPRLTT